MGVLDTVTKAVGAVTETVSNALTGSDKTNGAGTVRIQYYRSAIGFPKTQKQIVRSLGFTKLNQTVERPDTGAMRGAVNKVPHLLRIVE
jgi:large subunit ribosomal protein L30